MIVMTPRRITLDIVLFIALFIAPFWFPLLLVAFGLIAIAYYWESVVVLFCMELLYHGAPSSHGTFLVSAMPVIVLVLFFCIQALRKFVYERLFR